ncbi:MAG: glycerol kinase GlpK [Saprospiraceae bacterium]|nr:glycerol kinase GlpK [Saprospiraceae bacterium]
MSKKYILAIDQGTTSCRSLLIDQKAKVVAVAQQEFSQIFPQPGWVEHNAEEIWQCQYHTLLKVVDMAGVGLDEVAAIGITNQRETTVLWEKASGSPIGNAIVWQDRRTATICHQWVANGWKEKIAAKTGLVVDAYFSASKLRWMLDQDDQLQERAALGELAFGTIDSWLVWKLSQGESHITDVSNASRTMLYNIHDMEWDPELLSLFNIPASLLPEVKDSSQHVSNALIGGISIPICGIAGDQQAALFGQLCLEPGMVKNTYGTGCFMLMNTGSTAIESSNQLLSTVAWRMLGKTTYALEGSVFIGGAVVQWLRDGLHLIETASKVENLALMAPENEGVYFVPAFTGLGAPHWNQEARGCIFGISRGTTNAHIARAALESIAYQSHDVLKAMEKDSGINITQMRVDGGATANNLLMQFQSDIMDCNIMVPANAETTAMGAAYLAGLSVGFWKSTEEISQLTEIAKEYKPSIDAEKRQLLLNGWARAIKASIGWTQ